MAAPAGAAACRCRYASPTASVTGSGVKPFLHALVLLHEQAVQDNVGHARAVQGGQCGVKPGARASRAYADAPQKARVDRLRPRIPGSEAFPGSPGCYQLKPATYTLVQIALRAWCKLHYVSWVKRPSSSLKRIAFERHSSLATRSVRCRPVGMIVKAARAERPREDTF